MEAKKRRRRKKRISTRAMNIRILIAFGAILLLFVVYVGRIVWLDRKKGNEYEKKVLSQQSYVSNTIAYRRGDIVDRNGNKLATSKKVYNLVLDPQLLLSNQKYYQPTIDALAKAVGVKEDEVKEVTDKYPESHYRKIDAYKALSSDVVESFQALAKKDKNIKGVFFEEEYIRQYPYSTVASNVIGFCSSDNVGIWGIENQYNSSLSGTVGKKYGYYDSNLDLVEKVVEPQNGKQIVSTIDVNVQGVLEQHMQTFQKETGSKNMGCIIMNPQNGEIYAMASSPGYDLNDPNNLDAVYTKQEQKSLTDKQKMKALNEIWRNYCISDSYEPGSTFKPITVAACLDEGVTDPDQTYVCDGYQVVSGSKIKCVAFGKGGHGSINICQALMESCNDVMMQIGAKLGGKKFLSYVNDFGFGNKTGIDLPGEATGTVFQADSLRPADLATSSFGQSQTVTMVQMAAAFSATINGGSYYTPHVVKEVQSESGATVQKTQNTMVRKVVTEETSKLIRQYLYKTVDEGTAAPAKVAGYKIGGKTGTAEKYPRRQGKYLVSFIGFTPIDNPEVVIYVTIDEPNVEDQAHSTYATEFSSGVMKDVLPLLGIYQKSSKKGDETSITLPSTKKGNLVQEVPKGGYSDKNYRKLDSPEDTTEPQTSAEPQASTEPQATDEPQTSAKPQATTEPQTTDDPQATTDPNEE